MGDFASIFKQENEYSEGNLRLIIVGVQHKEKSHLETCYNNFYCELQETLYASSDQLFSCFLCFTQLNLTRYKLMLNEWSWIISRSILLKWAVGNEQLVAPLSHWMATFSAQVIKNPQKETPSSATKFAVNLSPVTVHSCYLMTH